MTDIYSECVLVLDFGSQYTHLITRCIREAGVYSEVHPCGLAEQAIKQLKPKAVILSGGPRSATHLNAPTIPMAVFELGVPVLGICYGMQAMVKHLGGQVVASSSRREFGHTRISVNPNAPLLSEIQDDGVLDVWMSHSDRVESLPDGFTVIASSDNAPIAAMADEGKHLYGLQFHPEVTHTPQGRQILQHFLYQIANCGQLWTTKNIIADTLSKIRQQLGDEAVLLALSGGVDSSVLAALLHQAVKEQLTCLFVDHGLLRLNEADQVMESFSSMGIRVIQVDARQRFMDALKGVRDPEAKRKIIGEQFIRVFEEQASKFSKIKWLAQGTIYPDVIESAGNKQANAQLIKSHHNVGGLPEHIAMELLEPLRDLFKDEVRQLGLALKLPRSMLYRHPFPGPGLAVRILGEVKEEYIRLLRYADHIFIEELRASDLYDQISQAFAVFLPIRSVGVIGDNRQYAYVIALRAVTTTDFMTAHWTHLPYPFLERVSNRIINEVEGISRVTYDISGKPPATIEWE